MLGELSEEEHAAGRGMLSVAVGRLDVDGQPGPDLFPLVRKLGRDPTDETTCWVEELKRVHGP
jgi:hypothetical protein